MSEIEVKPKRNQRTLIDWSEHQLKIKRNDNCLIHELKKENSSYEKIIFINTNDICAVTGDFGNYIFCREFHPTADGFVSDNYWIEKLQINSIQEPETYSPEQTRKVLEKGLAGELEEYGYEDEQLITMQEYYKKLLNVVDCSEWEYISFAYNEYLPNFLTAEDVPIAKVIKQRLLIIFDAFEEICKRLA